MSKLIEEVKKEDFVKDNAIRIIKDSEAVAMQAVDSAKTVLRAGLAGAEELSIYASDLLLNAARRAINAGNIISGDLREMTKGVVSGAVHAASEVGSEIKRPTKVDIGKSGEK